MPKVGSDEQPQNKPTYLALFVSLVQILPLSTLASFCLSFRHSSPEEGEGAVSCLALTVVSKRFFGRSESRLSHKITTAVVQSCDRLKQGHKMRHSVLFFSQIKLGLTGPSCHTSPTSREAPLRTPPLLNTWNRKLNSCRNIRNEETFVLDNPNQISYLHVVGSFKCEEAITSITQLWVALTSSRCKFFHLYY